VGVNLPGGGAGVEGFDLVHARILRFFPELVQELGGDPPQLVADAGIDLAELRTGVTYRQIVNLFEVAAHELDCPDFGLRLARLQSGGQMFGPLGLVMKNSRTFGEAIEYVAKHTYAHSLAARIWMQRFPAEGAVFMGHDILLDRLPNRSQAMEQILLLGHLGAVEITGGRARVRRVHFRHQPVSSPRLYRRYFGCEVMFGQDADGVVFFDRDLAQPIVDPDSQALARATSFIDAEFTRHRPPLHAETRGVIMQFLATGACTNDRVAAELNLHPKTMHRRLKGEGTSFQKIKDEVRRDLMLYYFQETTLDFACISERLGFAEQSVMTRTCNRWFAASPTRLRAQASRTESAG
jgi:AraC-like DNA-binding protein